MFQRLFTKSRLTKVPKTYNPPHALPRENPGPELGREVEMEMMEVEMMMEMETMEPPPAGAAGGIRG